MQPMLALETSTSLGSVAVGERGRLLAEVTIGVRVRHSESLLPAMDFALASAAVAPAALGAVVVGGGPGSFTGVRIAAATAKGLVRALDVPLLAYPSLAALAASLGAAERPVCALFDARRGEVYAACYRFPRLAGIEEVLAPVVLPVETLLERLAGIDAVYAGEGALRNRAAIEAAGGAVAAGQLAVPRASALLWLAEAAPDAGRIADPAAWEPLYLRRAGAERGPAG